MEALPGLRVHHGSFETGDVVRLDRVAYARFARGYSAMAEMAAKRQPALLGQVTAVDSATVEVIWEDGRLGVYAYPDARTALKWTTTEVLILE